MHPESFVQDGVEIRVAQASKPARPRLGLYSPLGRDRKDKGLRLRCTLFQDVA